MSKLAKFLSWCFAAAALVFGWISLVAAWGFVADVLRFLHTHPPETLSFRDHPALTAAAFVLVPLIFCAVYAMAWWTTQKATAHARAWATAANLIYIVLALAPLLLSRIIRRDIPTAALGETGLLVLSIGVAGFIVFSRRDALPETGAQEPQPARMRGDGTSKLVDTLVQFAGIAAVLAGLIWLSRWGYARRLPVSLGFWFWTQLVVADLVAVGVHELGHAAVGRALGMRVRAFHVGPFAWQIQQGRWKFEFHLANFFALTGGSAGLVPTRLNDSPWREVSMIAAGPAASLCLGLVTLRATLSAQGRPWAPVWQLLGLTAIISLVAFAVNLIPIRPEADYSDGAHIYQLLTHGPWKDVHRSFSAVTSSLVTPVRPRDFDAQTLRRAADFVTGGHRGFLLRMYLFLHYLDRGQIPEALEALGEAETVFEQSASDLPGEMLGYFVYASAFLKPDTNRARHWWTLMESKNPRRDCTEYWLARVAILWIDNQREEALKAWQQGNALAQKLPKAGAYEFERSHFIALRQMLGPSSAAHGQASTP